MSDLSKELDEALSLHERLELKQQELKQKKLTIEERRVNIALEKMNQDDIDLEKARQANFSRMSEEQLNALIQANDTYIDAAKKCMSFINRDFDDKVPFFRKNLLLIGARTGAGKSTAVANIVREILRQKRPDGLPRRAMVITNEERSEDFFNRVTALVKGFEYTNHDKITEEEKEVYNQYIKFFGSTGILNVIDNNYGGSNGVTTSIEGIKQIFDNLLASGDIPDAIVIDYYQNFKYSKVDPMLDEWKVQAKLAGLLDTYKNLMPCPIVLFCQVEPLTEHNQKPFELRIKGRKIITDPSTFIMELQAEKDESRTKCIIHKSRYTKSVGEEFYTGYDRGAFVPYTQEFIAKANEAKVMRMNSKIDKETGRNLSERAKNGEVQKKADPSGSDADNG